MNFDFSDDQKHLKGEARRFLAANCTIPRWCAAVLDDPAKKSYDEALWRRIAEQGWLGAAIPERFNGLGLGRLELCATIAEELGIGRVVAPIPFASTVLFPGRGADAGRVRGTEGPTIAAPGSPPARPASAVSPPSEGPGG